MFYCKASQIFQYWIEYFVKGYINPITFGAVWRPPHDASIHPSLLDARPQTFYKLKQEIFKTYIFLKKPGARALN